jgi:hypothetical protein
VNGIDLLIVLVVGLNAYLGVRRGLYQGLIDLFSLALSLVVATWTYPAGAWLVRKLIGLPGPFGELLGFILIAVLAIKLTSYLGLLIPEEKEPAEKVDKIGGGIIGGGLGVVLCALVLSALSGLPAHGLVEESLFGGPFVQGVPKFYEQVERIGFDLPKLVRLPRDYEDPRSETEKTQLQFRRLNFTRLDGATCIKCRGRMKFLGYQRHSQGPLSPKFQCTQCGRTTDGCQSFEGFHKMYRKCPTKVANDGYELDCGVWTNGDPVIPRGPCPVCGGLAKKQPP